AGGRTISPQADPRKRDYSQEKRNRRDVMSKVQNLLSHAVVGGLAALSATLATYFVVTGSTNGLSSSVAQAQAAGQRTTDVMTQALSDLAREMRVRMTERDPGNGSAA